MECTLAILADAANRADTGKLNVLGIFDAITSDKFPYAVPLFFVIVRLTAGPAEYGLKKQVELILLNPDGRTLGKIGASAPVPTPDAGGRASLELVVPLVAVPFEKPGQYAIAVLVNGEEKASIPIAVLQSKPTTTRGRRKKGDAD
jgi:hypothetical protein